jgi:phosphatidylglycerol---prolipoprotein diacylglyceryl transferase
MQRDPRRGCAGGGRERCRHPFRFEWRGRRFSSYTVMLYMGLVLALVVADAAARRAGLDARRVVLALLVLIPVALAGARGLAVLLDWRHFRARPSELARMERGGAARMERGGAAMYGGLPPALLLSVPLLALLGIPFGAFWDAAAVAILAGMIPTRLGCLTNGCCAGRALRGPFGLRLPNARGEWRRRFPSQLAEAALAAALLALVRAVWGALPFPGAALLVALGGYAAGRCVLDGLRERRGPVLLGLGACQWISLGLLALSALGLCAGAPLAETAAEAAQRQLAAGASAAGAPALLASGLLLLPVLCLFRFLGCQLVFQAEPDVVTATLQLAAIIPPTGPAEEFTATIALLSEPSMDQIAGSPFELPPKAPLPDGSLVFEALVDVPEGAYTASCTVVSPSVASRIGTCSGEVTGPGLAVVFFANAATLPNVVVPVICFEPPPA